MSSAQQFVVRQLVRLICHKIHETSWRTSSAICSAGGFAHLLKLSDDIDNEDVGYWFAKSPENIFEYTTEKERTGSKQMKKRRDTVGKWIYQGMLEQICEPDTDPACREKLVSDKELFISAALDEDCDLMDIPPEQREAFREKLEEIKDVELHLICLIMLTVPGPLFDFHQILYCNREDEKRNLFVIENTVGILEEDGTFRRFPWVLGELIVRYLIILRPLQRALFSYFEGSERLKNHHLFAYHWPIEHIILACDNILQHYEAGDDFASWRRTYVDKNCGKFAAKDRYKKWLDDSRKPTYNEVLEFYKHFETNSKIHQIGVEAYLLAFEGSSILPFHKLQHST